MKAVKPKTKSKSQEDKQNRLRLQTRLEQQKKLLTFSKPRES